jgi:hypothetical protein
LIRPALEALEDRCLPSAVFWTNSAGGSWSTPSNWSTGALPGPNDDVFIEVGGSAVITHSSGNDSIRSLTSSNALTVSGGTLNLNTTSYIFNTLLLSGGTLTGRGDLGIVGLFSWTGGTMSGLANTYAYGDISISGNSGKTLTARTVNAYGTTTVTGTGSLSVNGNAVWNSWPGATFIVQSDTNINGGPATFNNDGTIIKQTTSGMTTFGIALVNTGAVDIQSGTLNLNGADTHTGTLTVEAGATLQFGGGTQSLRAGSSVSGAGNVSFSGANVTVFGTYSITGNTTLSGGSANFDVDLTLPTLTLSGGSLGGNGTVTVTGLLTWNGGTMNGGGRTEALGGITIGGNGDKMLSARILDNIGTATWLGTGNIPFSGGAVWNNLAGSSFLDNNTSANASFGGSGTTFNNAGTFTKAANNAVTFINALIYNSGTVDAQVGTINFNGGADSSGAITAEAGAHVGFTNSRSNTLRAGSIISGAGDLTAAGGTTTIYGTFAITGNVNVAGGTLGFIQDVSFSTLSLNSGSLTSPSNIAVNGLLTWNGGNLTGTGHTVANGGINLATNGGKTLDGQTLDNVGIATWSGTGSITFFNGAVWNNPAGSILLVQNDATIGGASTGNSVFNNAGTFRKVTGTGTTAVSVFFNNTGTVDVQSGTVNMAGGGVNHSTYTAQAGATLQFGGGNQTLLNGSSVADAGNLAFFGGGINTLDPNATITVGGSLMFNGANNVVYGTLTVGGTTTITAGTNTFYSDLNLPALTVSGGTLTGPSHVVVTGLWTWSGGTLSGTGSIDANGNIAINGGSKLAFDRTINNAGFALWTAGNIEFRDNAVWNNLASAVFDMETDANFGRFSIFNGWGTFNNYGTYQKTAGTGSTVSDLPMNNFGGLYVLSGTLDLQGGGISSGTFYAGPGATLLFHGGNFILTDASYLFGEGTIAFDSLTFNGMTFADTGIVYSTGTVTLQATNLPFASPSVEFDSNIYLTTLNLTNGTLTGVGDVTIYGTWNWNTNNTSGPGSTLSGIGNTFAMGNIAIRGSGGKTLDSRTVWNYGSASWTGSSGIAGTNQAAFYNQDGALFDAQGDAGFTGSMTFFNFGTFQKSAGTGTTTIANFDNFGTVSLLSGTLSVPGTYYQSPDGTLIINIGGLTAGSQFSRLQVGGTAYLDGTLEVNLTGGFSPVAGNSFQIVTFATGAGTFATLDLPDLGSSLTMSVAYNSMNATLVTSAM